MSLTNILISWSKSPQYISNGRERRKEGGRKREREEERESIERESKGGRTRG